MTIYENEFTGARPRRFFRRLGTALLLAACCLAAVLLCASCAYLNKLAAEQEARDAGKPRVGIYVTGGQVGSGGHIDLSKVQPQGNGLGGAAKGLGNAMGNAMMEGAASGAIKGTVSGAISSELRSLGSLVPKHIDESEMRQFEYSPNSPFDGEQAKAMGAALGVDFLCLAYLSAVDGAGHYNISIHVIDAVDGVFLGDMQTEGYQNNALGSILTMSAAARQIVGRMARADAPRATARAQKAADDARIAAEAEAQRAAEEARAAAEAEAAPPAIEEPPEEPAPDGVWEVVDEAALDAEEFAPAVGPSPDTAPAAAAAPPPDAAPAPPPDTAKPRVAVYVAGSGGAEFETMGVIVGSSLAKAIKDVGKYAAKNLPPSVLGQHGYALSGSADGKQVKDVGKEFGVHYLCLVEVGDAGGGSSNLNARLADAATGETVKTASAAVADMEDVGQIMQAASKIALELSNWSPPPRASVPEPPRAPVDAGGADAVEMASVRGGTFTMGCTVEQGGMCLENEKPSRNVTISDFHIGKYPVTQKQWVQVMGANPSTFKGDDMPVESVTWLEVQEFIAKLNAMTGRRYRLPTEAEWEYAARGGIGSKVYMYAGSSNIEEVAWYSENSGDKTHPVGGKKPNELGLYDMSGNVNEWVGDWFAPYSPSVALLNPAGPGYGYYRAVRGGVWSDLAKQCRVSSRSSARPDFKESNLGFRLAYSADTALGPVASAAQAAPVLDGAPSIAVYVRSGIEDGELKAAFADELLFEFVKSGLYRPVEDVGAFTAAAEKAAAAEEGAGSPGDERIARTGAGARADMVCVVDATPIYEQFQVSARILDANSAAPVKMGVVDGRITNAEEFSAMVEKVVVALIGEAAYRRAGQPQPEPEPAAPAPVQAASPPTTRYHPPAAPRDEEGAAPRRKSGVSIGSGGLLMGGYGGGIGWPSGARVAMPYSGGGWYAFFDAKYVELVFGYYSGSGKWVSAAADNSDKLPNMARSGTNFGAFLKFPFGGETVKGFPIFGIDYEASSSGELRYGSGYGANTPAISGGDMSALWFKLGGGLDIGLGESFYLRSELLLGWRTANEYEKDAVSEERKYGNSASTVLGSGLALKLGLGYKF